MTWSHTLCPDCKTTLDGVAVDDACPGCGGFKRSTIVAVEGAETLTMVEEVSLEMTKGDLRPWTEKWLAALHCLKALRKAYSGDRMLSNLEVDARCLNFFVECDHLRDWLKGDVDVAYQGVTADDVHKHFQSSVALQRCNAICNSHKHHTRSSGITARIRSTSITPHGARVAIEVDWARPSRTTVDALELADDCVASWQDFFKTFGLKEP